MWWAGVWVESVCVVEVQAEHQVLPWVATVVMAAWRVGGMVARNRAVQGRVMA